ncbi:hypothetical protein KKA24_03395 [Patescibacteria group bacterium]|nr:hypothetical protein [Patescibacteria group bacterium]
MLRKIQITVMLMIALLSSCSVVQAESPDFADFGLKTHDFGIAFEVYEFDYEEEPDLMGENGTIFGIAGEYTFRDWIKNSSCLDMMFRAEARCAFGKVDYDGAYQDGTPFSYSGIDDTTFEIRGLAGLDRFILDDKVLATAYIGLGFRQLDDNAGVMDGGYDRQSQYLYFPIGCEFVLQSQNNWLCTLNAEYNHLINGRQTSELSALDISGLGDVKNKQKHGNGFRGSARFDYKVDGKKKFFIEPYVRLWRVGDSEVETSGIYAIMEPKNTTREIGVNVGIPF